MPNNPKEKYASIHYSDYLQLDKLLDAQQPRSGEYGEEAHDEMLFIIIHQVYELWFKQINHELKSLAALFREDHVRERNLLVVVQRMDRVIEILKLLVQQIQVLETLTPLDFLEFRHLLFPASGFQSFQFREFENLLGLREKDRYIYKPNERYLNEFTKERQHELETIEESHISVFESIERWLERTPFLHMEGFDFIAEYSKSVHQMLDKEYRAIENTDYLTHKQKAMRLEMLGNTNTYFANVLDPKKHQALIEEGKMRLSYKATVAALFIQLYRDEPILQLPYRLLNKLTDIDELVTTWRYRHAQMVLRMLGKKIGTGGSSGYEYLRGTAEKNQVFRDFHNISTLLIPRSAVPPLPDDIKQNLSFYYSTVHG